MRVLVTGSTGFVGGHLVEALGRKGDEVTALVRSPRKAQRFIGTGITTMEGDLHDTEVLAIAADGQEVVFHVAGLVAARDEDEFLRVNRDGTANLVQAAKRGGCGRIVLVSSLAAAGPSDRNQPRSGEEPAHPVTAYGRSKLAGEAVVRECGLPWTILRPPMVYGPWDTEVFKVFRVAKHGFAPVFGEGDQRLCAVYGPDLADALVSVAERDETVGRTYYPCHPEVFTSREFAEAAGRALGRRVRVFGVAEKVARAVLKLSGTVARLRGRATVLNPDKGNEFFAPAWTADPSPLTDDTGWTAAHDLAAGLEATVSWYRGQGWL